MPAKVRELKSQLRKAGFNERSAKGSHVFFQHPLLPKEKFSLSGNDGDDADHYQVGRVRQLLQLAKHAEERHP